MREVPQEVQLRALYPFDEGRHQIGGIGRTKAYEMAKSGELKLVKIGRRTFIPGSEIARLAGLKGAA